MRSQTSRQCFSEHTPARPLLAIDSPVEQLAGTDDVARGYSDRIFMLAFDHRDAFQDLFGIKGSPTAGDTSRVAEAKEMIFEGLQRAAQRSDPARSGALIDEQFGAPKHLPERIKGAGMKLAMPAEKSGEPEFELQYGVAFGDHIERFDPDFVKVLVRYNPDGDGDLNNRQATRLAELSTWLSERRRKLLFELLVPPEGQQLAAVNRRADRYDTELRPTLMVRAINELQQAGVEPELWKVEGLDRREDYEAVVAQCRADGRDEVACVLLGRGSDRSTVERWISGSAGVDGFVGFAIGRSIWGEPLAGVLTQSMERGEAIEVIAANYLHFVEVYESALADIERLPS